MSETLAPLTPDAGVKKARGRRNVWLALALAVFCLLIGVITVVKLSARSDEIAAERAAAAEAARGPGPLAPEGRP